MSSSSKFKLEVKSDDPRVAKFMSGTSDAQILIGPQYHSNIEYAVFGTKPATSTSFGMNETYIAIASSNDSVTTVASFNQSNISFHKDTVVRGNLVIDGFITTLNLDVALSPDDLFASAGIQNTFIDVASNTVLQKYLELTDTKLDITSNTITSLVASKYSNLQVDGNNILNTNAGFLSYYSMANVYDANKFDARLQAKTADEIANGISRKYIVNNKYTQNQLTIQGDLSAYNLQTAGTVIVDTDVNATQYYADGFNLTNLNAGDGTTNSLIEGEKLFFKPSHLAPLVDASNLHASNYVTTFFNDALQTLFADNTIHTSNYAMQTSNSLLDIHYTNSVQVSNYLSALEVPLDQHIQLTHLQKTNYVQENDTLSSNYMELVQPTYTLTQDMSNIFVYTIDTCTFNTSNYITSASNTLYQALHTADNQMQESLLQVTHNLHEIMSNKDNELSNMIVGADGYSNLLHNNLNISYNVHMRDYLTTSSNHLRQDIDLAKDTLIQNINTIAHTISTKITDDTALQTFNITTMLSDIIAMTDDQSLASSNNMDIAKSQILDYLSLKIADLTAELSYTSNLIHNSSNEIQVYLRQNSNAVSDYSAYTSNELVTILEQNINNLLGNAYNVLNQTNADISAKLGALSTNTIPEGTSNVYYTEARFDEKFATLTLDNFRAGSTNKFIVNNAFAGNLRVLGTIYTSNMKVDGDLSTINTDVYQTGSATIISSNDVNLNVAHYNSEAIMCLSNMSSSPVMIVANSGDIAVNQSSSTSVYDLDIAGALKATYFVGNANSITDINLTDKSTNFLAEDASRLNKYFDSNRVSYLIDACNLHTSNYVIGVSNIIFANLQMIRDQSNYILNDSNILTTISSNLYSNIQDYHTLASNNIVNMMIISGTNFSNYVNQASNTFIEYANSLPINSSNYLQSACNLLFNQLSLLEYHQSNYITSENTIMSNLILLSSSNASNYVLRTSNTLVTQMQTGFETNQSNYVIRSCNMLFDQLTRINFHLGVYTSNSSNNIMRPLNASNIGVSNYILRTSNELMTYVNSSLSSVSATANKYSITDVYAGDKILHFNFNNIKIINNADDNNFQLLNRTAITPVYPNITSTNISTANNFFAQYETTNRFAIASSNNIYVFNNDDTDMRTILNMMNTSGFVIHFVFRAQFVQNTPIFFIGNNTISMLNIKLLYGNLHITLGSPLNFITIIVSTPIVPMTWYVVDIFASIQSGSILLEVFFNKILQNFIMRTNTTSTTTPLLLQSAMYNSILQYNGTVSYGAIDGNISTSFAPALISGNDYCFFFTGNNVSYTVTVAVNTVCDILMIGGGGSGGDLHGGGGGAGAMVFMKSVTLPVGTYTFTVGGGGINGTAQQKGANTTITVNGTNILVAEGGGAGSGGNPGGNGGSGGGGDGWGGPQEAGIANNPGSSIFTFNGVTGVKYGNNGGNATSDSPGGGGGGAGTAGKYALDATQGSYGGDGRKDAVIGGITYDFVTVFGSPILNYGVNNDNNNTRYFAGGGTGGRVNYSSKGGGGRGGQGDNIGITAGIANTGSGGGGGGANGTSQPGAAGGSGIIILRATINQLPVTKYVSVSPLRMLLGCSNLTDTYEENFPYTQGFTYTNTYFSSNSYITNTLAPIMRSSAHNYNSFSNLIFSSYFASNYDYQYSSNISSLNSAIIANSANASFYQNFHDNADATRLTIGDRTTANLNFVFTEVETNIRLQTGYYYFMLDLQNEVTADLLLGEQSDTSIDNYLNVANYYNSNLLNAPSATIAHTSNQVLTYPLYIPEGYYRFYLRMLRTIPNRNIKYFIPQYYYTNTWTSPSYSLNNSNAFTYISYSTLNSTYQTGRTLNINDRFMVNNNRIESSSNLYVYSYVSYTDRSYACGYNSSGQLGINSTAQSSILLVPVRDTTGNDGTTITNISQVAAGNFHSLFLEKTTGKVYACGINDGQLGINSTTQSTILVPVRDTTGNAGTTITNILQVAAGNGHSLFLEKDTGKVYACGYNGNGELGIKSTTQSTILVPVRDTTGNAGTTITNILQVAAGYSHSLFLEKTTGKVYACGYNYSGELGINSTAQSTILVPVRDTTGNAGTTITNISQVAAGSGHSLFLEKDTGKVYACGDNGKGQLGINSTTLQSAKLVPVRDTTGNSGTTITNISQVAAGVNHSLFLEKDTGKVYACGNNYSGQLGINSTANSLVLVPVRDTTGNAGTTITNISQVAASGNHSLFLEKTTGIVYACGNNGNGQLGINSTTQSTILVPVRDTTGNAGTTITNILQVAAGYNHSLFIANIPIYTITNVSNYNYNISHSNLITPTTFFAANRYSSSNLLNIQDFKIFNNPIVMGSDYSINNILFNGKDKENIITINKLKHNKWQETADYSSLTNKFIYYDEGNISIGNTTPLTASLDINTNILTTYNAQTINSLKTNRSLWTNLGVITSSDERIKTNLKDIDDFLALNQILKIEPKKYNYIDKDKDQKDVYGFIAQQVRDVIPNAVTLHKQAIPNIYTIATVSNNVITFNYASNIQDAKSILLIAEDGKQYTENIQSISHTEGTISIIIHSILPYNSIFVYGTYVEDFHAIDKSYIYTLNVCALQDLHRQYIKMQSDLSSFKIVLQQTSNLENISVNIPIDDMREIIEKYETLKTNIAYFKHANNLLAETMQASASQEEQSQLELDDIRLQNQILTSNQQEIMAEQKDILNKISSYTQEIFTIKSIMQLNNIS